MLSHTAKLLPLLAIGMLASAGSSQSKSGHEISRKTAETAPLVLSVEEGERRVRKWSGSFQTSRLRPTLLPLDGRKVSSPVAFYVDVASSISAAVFRGSSHIGK